MKKVQSLGNSSYSISHKSVLIKKDRERVGGQLVAILQDHFGKKSFKNLKTLDVGCSGGTITNLISNYTGKMVGIDIDEHAIKQASLSYGNKKNLSFKHTIGINIPYTDKSFDLVVCNQVYSYTTKPNGLISEIYRVLKQGGTCLFTGDNLLRPIEPLYKLPLIRWLPNRVVKHILKKRGYKNIYIGKYKTYWGLVKMCRIFTIKDYTTKVLKNPKKYKFSKLYKYEKLLKRTPKPIFKLFEPLFPTFVFILEKR